MKTYTVKLSRSVVEYREILINCENEEELIELLDEKLEKVWSEGDEIFDERSSDEIDLIRYWENEEFDEKAMTVVDFCDRRSRFKTFSRRSWIRQIWR
ncbi:MAG: hypothetical protein PHY54_15885 [Methylococcales bacterium]|nr:hypothetical protein [Methylococcales bacterium]